MFLSQANQTPLKPQKLETIYIHPPETDPLKPPFPNRIPPRYLRWHPRPSIVVRFHFLSRRHNTRLLPIPCRFDRVRKQ